MRSIPLALYRTQWSADVMHDREQYNFSSFLYGFLIAPARKQLGARGGREPAWWTVRSLQYAHSANAEDLSSREVVCEVLCKYATSIYSLISA